MNVLHADAAPKAIGPYSHAIEAAGLLFCSGQTPIDPATGQLVPGAIEEQTRQALANVSAVLAARGLTLQHVVKSLVFLKNFADFQRMNAVYADTFGGHKPARSTVEVSRLPMDCLVEIEVVAEVV
jgi:2-iminobutanoate/2-iminopropanoate deaminase